MSNGSGSLWSFVAEIIFSSTLGILFGIFVENRFGITLRIKKAYYFLINKNAGFEINLTLDEIDNFDKVKIKFINLVREKYGNASQKKNLSTKLELLVDNYIVNLHYLPTKELFISTTRIECGIREIKSKLTSFTKIVGDLKNEFDINSKEVSFKIFMPFKWNYVSIVTPKNLVLKDYEINFDHNEFDSVIRLKMNSIRVDGTENSLSYILDSFVNIF